MGARSVVVVVLALLALTAAIPAGAAASSAATPTIEGPVAGTPSLASTNFDLASVGYEQAEYFLSGTATAYTSATPLSSDGKWKVTPGTTAPYKTRMVVYRPTDPKKFNGTVIVEWNNVSAGLDSAPIWLAAHDELIREGYAWVGVTAQQVGVEGGGRGAVVANLDLKHADPARYGTLVHPGDSYSYDMYTQAGRAVRSKTANVLGGLVPKRVIAAGESQSAFRMTTYIDAVEPLTKGVYDGYFVYSRGGSGAALSQAPLPAIPTPTPTLIRTDLTVPVMTFTTETDLVLLGYLPARQPDTKRFRDWEVAGTSHADSYTLNVAGQGHGRPRGRRPVVRDDAAATEQRVRRGHHLQLPVQLRADDVRAAGIDRRAQHVDRTRHRATEGPTPAGDRRLEGAVRARRRRQREGWDPHPAGRRPGRHALGTRAVGHQLLRDLRHHQAVRRRHPGGALPVARRVREGVERGDRQGGQGRVRRGRRRRRHQGRRRAVPRRRLTLLLSDAASRDRVQLHAVRLFRD